MLLGDLQEISESQLIGNSVVDRQGYLLGTVTAVNSLPNDQFALVVQFPVSNQEVDELIIESHQLKEIHSDTKTIHTDLDFKLVVSKHGKTIPLVEEKLVVTRQRHKLGEIVVRKVIETDWVQVPVYREKLVVQKVGEAEPISEVSLGETRLPANSNVVPNSGTIHGATHTTALSGRQPESLGQWSSIDGALDTLGSLPAHGAIATAFPIRVTMTTHHNDATNSEPVRMEFASLPTAIQVLTALKSGWNQQCQSIQVEKL